MTDGFVRGKFTERRHLCLRHRSAFGLATSFGVWRWKRFQQCPLTWWIFVASFIEIPSLNMEITRRVEWLLTDNRLTAGRPRNLMPLVANCWQRRHRNKVLWKMLNLDIRQPGFDLPRQSWSLLKHCTAGQGPCRHRRSQVYVCLGCTYFLKKLTTILDVAFKTRSKTTN